MKVVCVVVLFAGFYCVSGEDVINETTNAIPENEQNKVQDNVSSSASEIVKQMLYKRCSRQYSMTCLKLDIARLVDRLSSSSTTYQILPGVSVVSQNNSSTDDFPTELIKALAKNNKSHHQKLDSFLLQKLNTYIGSLTLNLKLVEPSALLTQKSSNDDVDSEGRRKKNGLGSTLATAGLFSGGTLMAVGMSALAALAGKALMTALLSLMLSAISALKGSGDHKSTTYEIVTRPVVSHAHTHSSEVQHEAHHGGGGGGGGVHHASGYGYARSMVLTPVLPKEYPEAEDVRFRQLPFRGHKESQV